MYKCELCDFVSMNEKSLKAHMETEHPQVEKKKKRSQRSTFLHNLLNKNVKIETLSGKILTGIFVEYNSYEIKLKLSDDREILLWKQGLLMICEDD